LIRRIAGPSDVLGVYGNVSLIPGWQETPGFRVIHSGTVRNSADMLLVVDAMDLALSDRFRTFPIASSDGDFAHVAWRLRDRGRRVIGVGERNAPETFRAACSAFEPLAEPRALDLPVSAVAPLDAQIRSVIACNSRNGQGVRINDLSHLIDSSVGSR
jgi:hypothetical protein